MNLEVGAISHALNVGLRSGSPAPLLLGGEIRIFEQLVSTNDSVAEEGRKNTTGGLTIFAESQSAGRGRKGRSWQAPAGSNLLFSVLARPETPFSQWPRLAHAAGLAVARGIEPWLPDGIGAQLKWPNDVYVDGRKISGILLESFNSGQNAFLVLGIGINVNSLPADYPPELARNVTSLRYFSPRQEPVDRNQVAGSVLAELNRAVKKATDNFEALVPELERRSFLIDRPIRFRRANSWEHGTVTGYGPDGQLKVARPDGTEECVVSADFVRLAEEDSLTEPLI